MKSAVNDTGLVSGVENTGNGTNARDQIVDGRGAELAECGFKGNTASFG